MSTGHIPRSFIDDLLARTDIAEIIGNRIQLKKAGRNFIALCPFHTEKTPSFTVSPSKQFYYCFGCGAHGNVISFLMDYDRLEFVDAIETLAAHLGLEVPHETSTQDNSGIKDFYPLLLKTSKYYQQQLRQSKQAIDYLKNRGLSGEICQHFNIGYALSSWDGLLNELGKTETIRSELVTTGMLIKKDIHFYDRFRERVMFPIRDQRGRVVGFGGRTLGNDSAKYLNSPETPIFNKSQELYGLYEAKRANQTLLYLIIVEGYMDVISLTQHGITCSVATLGTATTIKHIQKLLRFTEKLIFCFDGDAAGKKAAWRALENTLPLMRDGVQALFLFLPQGEDPDSQVRKEGKTAFLDRIKTAIPLSEFFFKQLQTDEQINLNSMDGRAKMAETASRLLNKIPGGVFQHLMFEKLAKLVHLDVTELRNCKTSKTKIEELNAVAKSPSLLRFAIQLLLHYPQLAEYIENIEKIANINIPNIQLLVELLNLLKHRPGITTGAILEYWRERKEAPALAKLAAKEIPIPAQNLKSEFIGTIKRLYEYGQEQTIQELLDKANSGNISKENKIKLQKLIFDAKINILTSEE